MQVVPSICDVESLCTLNYLHFRSELHEINLAWLRVFSLCLNSFVVILPNQLHQIIDTTFACNELHNFQWNSARNSQLCFEVHNWTDNYVMKLPSL